ncbi:MAG: glycogen synthase [bacterium]|nr:MAG: glycogen synthase [bacterium]
MIRKKTVKRTRTGAGIEGVGVKAGSGGPLKVLMVAAEAAPFAKVGGLGDVVGSLPSRLAERGLDVMTFLPLYREVGLRGYEPEPTGVRFTLREPGSNRECGVRSLESGGARYCFLEEPGYFDRAGIYGPAGGEYPDSALRYSLLCRGALAGAEALDFRPDVVHCHDWHASLAPLNMRFGEGLDRWREVRSVLTIHNLSYQGAFGTQLMPALGLPETVFTGGLMEYAGRLNFLKGGIEASDVVTTVSPTYAEEIRTVEQGWGLDGVLQGKGSLLRGILNGIDYDSWDPARDGALAAPFSARDPSGRRANREVLMGQLGLYPDKGAPLFAFVGRMVHQKGSDILARVIGKMAEEGLQVVILGTGDFSHEESLRVACNPYPGLVSLTIGFNDSLARRIYAASDFFLMPSRFEPCGLGQMIAMRYGSLPVARATGGLKDTVVDMDVDPDRGNGFLFGDADEKGLWEAVSRAVKFFRSGALPAILGRVMSEDHSWRRSAGDYQRLYEDLLAMKGV